MSKVHYLTPHDVIWLNTQITGAPQPFDQPRLEDGVYYQYGFPVSKDVLAQSHKLLDGLAHKRPFAKGNKATATASYRAFLLLNGYTFAFGNALKNEDPHFHLTTAEACEQVMLNHNQELVSIYEAEKDEVQPLVSEK